MCFLTFCLSSDMLLAMGKIALVNSRICWCCIYFNKQQQVLIINLTVTKRASLVLVLGLIDGVVITDIFQPKSQIMYV
jgi:hypothetical protein